MFTETILALGLTIGQPPAEPLKTMPVPPGFQKPAVATAAVCGPGCATATASVGSGHAKVRARVREVVRHRQRALFRGRLRGGCG